jgi:hypothetical protein
MRGYGPYRYKRPGLKKGVRRPKGTKKFVTRQRIYQLRQKGRGKCILCGRKRGRNATFCDICLARKATRVWPGPLEA